MSVQNQKSQQLHRVAECLYRNDNGTYFAWVKVKGKQIRKSLQTTDRQLANRRLADLREKAARLHGSEHRNIHFEELAAIWLASIKPDLKPASHERRQTAVNGLTPFLKGLRVRLIGFSDIEEWKTARGTRISARSYNIELETLALIFRYAINRGILLENPCDKFKRRKQPHREIETFSRDQFSLLVNGLRNSAKAVTSGAADMIEFLAYSGMRIGEAREIRRRDINFEQNTIRITGGETGTKTHRERTIPIFPSLRKQLDRIFSRRPDLLPSSLIFQIDTPRKALALACKRLGLPQFTIHSLRHFFATNAIESGISFKTVASWFGHSDGGVLVARTYGHLRKEFMQDAAEKMTFHVAEASTLD